jgi:very-short-patch-repair endonuclease
MDSKLFPASRQRLSNVSQLAAQGVDKDKLKEMYDGKLVQRIRRGVYSPEPLPARGTYLLTNGLLDLGYLAEARSIILGITKNAVVGGRTAALFWGFDLLVEPEQVEVVVPPGGRRRSKDFSVFSLDERPVKMLRVRMFDAIPVLDAVATVLHCAQILPLNEAVTIADSAMRNKTVTRRELAEAIRKEHGKPHYRRMRTVLQWSDEHSGSVLESAFRVLMLENSILRPRSQKRIRGVGRVDFCWERDRLVVELDGRRWHDPEDARNNDRRRDNRLELQSWRLLRYTWADVVHDPQRVVAEVRQALGGWMAAA